RRAPALFRNGRIQIRETQVSQTLSQAQSRRSFTRHVLHRVSYALSGPADLLCQQALGPRSPSPQDFFHLLVDTSSDLASCVRERTRTECESGKLQTSTNLTNRT